MANLRIKLHLVLTNHPPHYINFPGAYIYLFIFYPFLQAGFVTCSNFCQFCPISITAPFGQVVTEYFGVNNRIVGFRIRAELVREKGMREIMERKRMAQTGKRSKIRSSYHIIIILDNASNNQISCQLDFYWTIQKHH